MLDLNLFRDDRGGCVDLLKENQSRRFQRTELIDEVTEADVTWRQSMCELWCEIVRMETLNGKLNEISMEIDEELLNGIGSHLLQNISFRTIRVREEAEGAQHALEADWSQSQSEGHQR